VNAGERALGIFKVNFFLFVEDNLTPGQLPWKSACKIGFRDF